MRTTDFGEGWHKERDIVGDGRALSHVTLEVVFNVPKMDFRGAVRSSSQ